MNGYSHASHTTKVLKASAARCGPRSVLQCLCARSDFRNPTVIITKDQIIAYTGLQRKAVQRALALLRDEGSIKAINGEKGGKGVPVTYELVCVAPKPDGASTGAPMGADVDRRSKAWRDAHTRIMRDKGVGYGEARKMADDELGIAA